MLANSQYNKLVVHILLGPNPTTADYIFLVGALLSILSFALWFCCPATAKLPYNLSHHFGDMNADRSSTAPDDVELANAYRLSSRYVATTGAKVARNRYDDGLASLELEQPPRSGDAKRAHRVRTDGDHYNCLR